MGVVIEMEELEIISKWYQVSLWREKNGLEFIAVIAAQHCKWSKNNGIVHLKLTNCMVCELYINKAVTKKEKKKTFSRAHLLLHWA